MSDIKVLIVDNDRDRGLKNARSFLVNSADSYLFDGEKRCRVTDSEEEVDLPDNFTLVLLHDNDEKEWLQLEKNTEKIIRYTGGNPHTESEDFWIARRSITSDQAISESEAKEILYWVESRSPQDKLPEIMKPPITVKWLLDHSSEEYKPWKNLLTSFLEKFNIPRAEEVDQTLVVDLLHEHKKVPETLKSEGDWGIIPNEEIPRKCEKAQEDWSGAFKDYKGAKKRLLLWSKLEYYLTTTDYTPTFSRLMGGIKPIIYVFDDYNNYIECEQTLYRPKKDFDEETICEYYKDKDKDGDKKLTPTQWNDALKGFCITLNNLSLVFDVKAPPLWIPKADNAGYDLVSAALPLAELNRERSQIAAFIIDLEWLPTITDYDHQESEDRKSWQKMGRFAIKILSQFYPEIPSFIFTGLEPNQELQEGLSYGAVWGFQKEKTHHYQPPKTPKQLTEKLTHINLKQQLTRVINVKYGSYQEVPFPNQLKIEPSHQPSQKLLQQLRIKAPLSQSSQGKALEKLIASLLPNATSVEPIKVLTAGKSKAEATFFVSPTIGKDKLATRFIKIGPWLSVQKEYLAYQSIIQPRLNSHTANLIHRPILAEGEAGEMPKGALMYSLAGLPEDYQNLQSLDELIEKNIETPEGDKIIVERLQNTLETVLHILYRSGASQQEKQPLWRWLGDILPPLYTGILIPLPQTSYEDLYAETTTAIVLASKTAEGYKNTAAWTLASFDLTELNIALEEQRKNCQVKKQSEDPSHWKEDISDTYKRVLLDGWYLYNVEWENGDLGNGVVTLIHPDLGIKILLRGQGKDIRLRFGATWIRPGMKVKVLACLDINNQEQEKIKRKINENLSGLGWLADMEKDSTNNDIFEYILQRFAQANSVNQHSLTSPFKVFSQNSLLPHHYTITAHAGVIHGDLNLNNLLYTSRDSVGWLIDFELVKAQGMIAFDLAKLEVEIWNHHLSPYLTTVAKLTTLSHAHSGYQLLDWCLQALDFAGDETAFFISKVRSTESFCDTSESLLVPITNALKIIKVIRRFGVEKCQLTQGELKWALAAYFFNAVKFQSQTKKYKSASACTAIFAFIASAWHLDAVLPTVE
jgi:hypothetical protein